MYPILQIGPLAIQLPGLLLLVGLWIGTQIAERETARYKLDPGLISNMIFIALAAGIVGARLGYALKYIDLYLGFLPCALSYFYSFLFQQVQVEIQVFLILQ